jgi:hypothetical protein
VTESVKPTRTCEEYTKQNSGSAHLPVLKWFCAVAFAKPVDIRFTKHLAPSASLVPLVRCVTRRVRQSVDEPLVRACEEIGVTPDRHPRLMPVSAMIEESERRERGKRVSDESERRVC